VLGHSETISTVQLDFYLPERFSLEFVDADAQRKRPVMIHRGVLSTAERIMAFLIEHYAGRFPLWLAPVQVKVLTVTDGQHAPAREFSDKMRAAGLRVELDLRSEKIGHKVRDATLERVPYQVVIGPRDVEAGTLSVRLPAGKQLQGVDPAQFAARLGEEVAQKRTTSVFT
jgi:threonyl-tRNA synthetase